MKVDSFYHYKVAHIVLAKKADNISNGNIVSAIGSKADMSSANHSIRDSVENSKEILKTVNIPLPSSATLYIKKELDGTSGTSGIPQGLKATIKFFDNTLPQPTSVVNC